jgi:hypothetical protein
MSFPSRIDILRCRASAERTKEPVGSTNGQVLVMRKSALLLSITAAVMLLVTGFAAAKGSKLRFDEEQYAPGDRAIAHALVETWPASGQPEDAPFAVYLVRGRQPLWFGHLPSRAIPVGELRIGHQVPDTTEVGDSYRVTVALDVPRVSNGRYAVWVCAPAKGGKGCWIGFGDLVYGRLIVARETGPAPSAEPDVEAVPQTPRAALSTSPGDSIPWVGLALAVAAVTALTALLVRRRQGHTSA